MVAAMPRPDFAHTAVGQRLHVSMFIHAFYPRVGGAETQLQELIRPLRQRGVDVEVLTRRYPGMEPRARVEEAPVWRLPSDGPRAVGSLRFTGAALAHLQGERRQVDVLHAHHLLSPTTTAVLAKLTTGRPVVVTVHGSGSDIGMLRSSPLGGARLRAFARLVDAFVAISDEIEQELLKTGVPPDRIARIPNGVDTERFRPVDAEQARARRQELGLGAGPTAVYVGRLEPIKGVDVLVDAWPAVRAQIPDAELVMVGDGSLRAGLEARQTPGTRFVGAVRATERYLQASDGYVLPSHTEGLPVALLEALATGAPCVATRVGGSAEVLSGLAAGRLVPPGDARALAEAVTGMLREPATISARREARQRVEEAYSLQSVAERLTALYRKLARRGART